MAHPNAAPFVSLRLIQHLVKSNPSSAYLGRVAATGAGWVVNGSPTVIATFFAGVIRSSP